MSAIGKQSPDINQGVDRADPLEQGAGDQGLMFGYATNETDVLMPAPITYAHRLVQRQAEVRKNGTLPWLRPDAKSQVTFQYDDGKIVGSAVGMRKRRPEERPKKLPRRRMRKRKSWRRWIFCQRARRMKKIF